jgi:hypothetical protein
LGKNYCYFVVWTKCDYTEVVVEKDTTFQGVMELLECAMSLPTFILTFSAKRRRKELKNSKLLKRYEDSRSFVRLRVVNSRGFIFFLCQKSLGKKSQQRRLDLNKNRFGLGRKAFCIGFFKSE